MIVAQEDELEQERQVRRLEERLKRLTIIGTPETLVAGNLEQGYSVDTHRGKAPIGACCVGSDCTVITEQECTDSGGTYQGDWTDCDPNPCSQPTGICCDGYDCSVTIESDCTGIWVEGFVCEEVLCCDPYFEVHVEVVTCGTEGGGSCVQTIDLTASVDVPSVVESDGCCTDNLSGTGGAVDVNGNTISLSVSSLGGGSLSWFVNVTPNCPTSYGAASMGGTETGDCNTGGTTVYPINVVFGGGSCDGHLYTAVGTITVTWHG